MCNFGERKQLSLNSVWKDEAKDFTPWLSTNLHFLSKELGLDLELEGIEVGVGGFSLDILAKDLGTNRNVIIENQYGTTNHDHLGKVITYAAGHDAYIAIWIAESFRDEHRQALDWLNHRSDQSTQFFGIVPEVIKIDDSRPALQLKLVIVPNDWSSNQNSEPSERAKKYKAFFQRLIDIMREEHHFTSSRKGQYQSWYAFSSGFAGIAYGANFTVDKKTRVEVYFGSPKKEMNKSLFDQLCEIKDEVEKDFGTELNWERLDNKKASRIAIYRKGSIDNDDAMIDSILSWQIENLLKFKKVFTKHIENIANTAM